MNGKVLKNRFKTKRDGLSIRGKIYGELLGTKPVVILCHGFMANQSMCKNYALLLAKMGYIAVTFDFCGGGLFCSSDGKTTEMSVFSEVDDLEAVLAYVMELPCVDKNRISLLGCSQGGVVSAIVAKRKASHIDKLLLFYPALCIPDDARSGKMVFAKFNPDSIPEKIWCGPMRLGKCYVETVLDLDIFQEICGYEGNVFLVHGDADKLVDISYSRKAAQIYKNVNYYEIKNGAHGFRGKNDEIAKELLYKFML